MSGLYEEIALTAGDIVAVRAAKSLVRHVVVLDSPRRGSFRALREVRVAPLSSKVELATSFDVVLSPEETPFGGEHMVEIWNQRTVLERDLGSVAVGHVGAATLDVIYGVNNSFVAGDELPDAALHRIGAPLREDDARLAYQSVRADAMDLLAEGALHALSAWEAEGEWRAALTDPSERAHLAHLPAWKATSQIALSLVYSASGLGEQGKVPVESLVEQVAAKLRVLLRRARTLSAVPEADPVANVSMRENVLMTAGFGWTQKESIRHVRTRVVRTSMVKNGFFAVEVGPSKPASRTPHFS